MAPRKAAAVANTPPHGFECVCGVCTPSRRPHTGARSLTPPTPHRFGGPTLGPAALLPGLPLMVWALAVYLGPGRWPSLPALVEGASAVAASPASSVSAWVSSLPSSFAASFTTAGCYAYLAWFSLQLILHAVLPGPAAVGTQLADGSRLPYKVNGWRCFVATHVLAWYLHESGTLPITWLATHVVPVTTASILFSILLSVYLNARSFAPSAGLAEGGATGHVLYDAFMGRELNPRVPFPGLPGGLDLKFFCELRPGLFLWHFYNISFAAVQVARDGELSSAMALVLLLQGMYVADAVWNESAILTTMDITQDGFGFMLAFGDLAWLPSVYSLQARFLADEPGSGLSGGALACCAVVAAAGYYVFRASNGEKDEFKRLGGGHPSHAGLRVVKSPTGSVLLADGWWGAARHVNYAGDWLLSLGMSLPTGGVTPLTYLYPAYFAVLLAHRERRDEAKCSAKYGATWVEYCKLVPWRIIPGLY